MKRAEFIEAYAGSSGLRADFADIGLLDAGGRTMVALPCACGEKDCEGWAMLSADSVLDHLQFRAPEKLRLAYDDAIRDGVTNT